MKQKHGLNGNLGTVVQSIVSLTSSLAVKILTVLVSTISNSQVFLPKCQSYSQFFSKNISVYAIFNDQSFNDTLTKDILDLNNWTLKNSTENVARTKKKQKKQKKKQPCIQSPKRLYEPAHD